MSKLLSSTPILAVVCRDVEKQYYLYQHRTTSLREVFIRTVRRRPIHIREVNFNLQNFNLEVAQGETVGLVGRNGCGKSTVLRLIAGIYLPTGGTIETFGRVAAVIELGAGFHMELTGAENVELYSAIMGLTRSELAAHRDEIVEFAGLGEFINTPVKYYSSGMQARLAFSVAVCVQPDILLIDEVMVVGDQEFQEKCFKRLTAFQASGGTMVIVSHDLSMVGKLCSRAIWLDKGVTQMVGEVGEVLAAYQLALTVEAQQTEHDNSNADNRFTEESESRGPMEFNQLKKG